MLMQVPPYIWSDCSTMATRCPALAIAAAKVFPLSNPTVRRDYEFRAKSANAAATPFGLLMLA